ncbi:MAG: hypothetical protein J5645_05690 [Lachnospiraceae bacterium]|nr:hypothetical protein [Lachnospiraceae bacterium]
MPRALLLPLLCVCAAVLLCACTGLPGSEDVSATMTPAPTATPSENAPTATPEPSTTPTAAPTATPTPVDISGLSDGGCNACAEWNDDDTLKKAAPVTVGTMIYANNFERDRGNRLASGNTFNDADAYATDVVSFSGMYSYKVSKRLQDYHGMSGLGFRLDERNGLSYKDLVGKTIRIDCRIYYTDEGFGVADTLNFALFDAYRTVRVFGLTYEKVNGDVQLDRQGRPVRKDQDSFPIADSYPVRAGQWTACTFYLHVDELPVPADSENPEEDTAKALENGCLLLATIDEVRNSVGLYCSYYIDDLTITVVPDDEVPTRAQNRRMPISPLSPKGDTYAVLRIPDEEPAEQ